jgi:tetratricopeptide (TPR) repeat protein
MIDRNAEITRAVRQRDIETVRRLMFDNNPPRPKSGFLSEGELWDYKREIPTNDFGQQESWASLAKDVLAFHNNHGGVIVLGIDDSYRFYPVRRRYDSKLINDQLRKYVGDVLWCEFHREFIQADQSYLGMMLIPPRGARLVRFQADGYDGKGVQLFREGESAIREGDSSLILRGPDVESYTRRLALPRVAKIFDVDDPYFRILAPDYTEFVERPAIAQQIERALKDPRISTVSLLGIGGAGKTAIATWAVLKAYERQSFPFIVSMTAKDRELTATGIQALPAGMSSFDSLLDSILEVLGFPDLKSKSTAEREREVRTLLTDSKGLLFIDNLETVDDTRIITFLDELPVGVRAIITSRRTRVRVAVRPVEVGPLTPEEVAEFIRSLEGIPGFAYLADLTRVESERIGQACDRIPLAIRWALARASSAPEALHAADSITKSGRRGEELLEFSFRRVFDGLELNERRLLETLSLFQAPLSLEAILVGSSPAATAQNYVLDPKVLDSIEQLVDDALIQRVFDPVLNDYAYVLLPITRAFVYGEVSRNKGAADAIRTRLRNFFEATDVVDADARLVIRESRQGKGDTETNLLDLAISAKTRGDSATARQLFSQALQRNPRSWKVARAFAEFHRHDRGDKSEALRLYEQAAANAPTRGPDRALIFREWGMLLRDSGRPDATERAVEALEQALAETPNDPLAAHALASMLFRQGKYRPAVSLLEPLVSSRMEKTVKVSGPLLYAAYSRLGENLKATLLRDQLTARGISVAAG